MSSLPARISVSVFGLCLIVGYKIWPDVFELDSTTAVFLVIALVPWIMHFLKSVEFPGGVKITLHDLQSAGEKVVRDQDETKPRTPKDSADVKITPKPATLRLSTVDPNVQVDWSFLSVSDPQLALVGLRIEIEKRLREFALVYGIPGANETSMKTIVGKLRDMDLLTSSIAIGLTTLISLGNDAAHGRPVDATGLEWARDQGAQVILVLDGLLDES